MNFLQKKKQIKKINELIDALSSMTPEARDKFIECLTTKLEIIEEQIDQICEQQYSLLDEYKEKELTDEQILILHIACVVACYSVGGALGKLTGNNEFFTGLVYSIVLSLPTTALAKIGIEKNYLENRLLISKYKKLDKEIIKLCKEKDALEVDIYNAKAYNYMIAVTERFAQAYQNAINAQKNAEDIQK